VQQVADARKRLGAAASRYEVVTIPILHPEGA
jgi:hypothetical protein